MTTPYSPTTWVDDQSPDIDDLHLNKMENGIKDATSGVIALEASTASLGTRVGSLEANTSGSLSAHLADHANPHQVTLRQVGGRHTINAYKRGASPDNADNWSVFQACLDEIRDSGLDRELYIPRLDGRAYKTTNLWVPDNCRIVSDGAVIQNIGDGGNGNVRLTTIEGATTHYWTPRGIFGLMKPIGAWMYGVKGVTIEGLRIEFVRPMTGLPGVPPIGIGGCGGDDCVIRDVTIVGSGSYLGVGVEFGYFGYVPQHATFERVTVSGGGRNGWELLGGRYITLRDCGADHTSGAGRNPDDPGAGIDVELESGQLEDLKILGGNWNNNAGAGIALVPSNNSGNASANEVLVEGAVIHDNGYGNIPGGTKGGIWIVGPNVGAPTVFRIVGCAIRNNSNGPGINVPPSSSACKVIAVGNALNDNGGGAWSAMPSGVQFVESGNIT